MYGAFDHNHMETSLIEMSMIIIIPPTSRKRNRCEKANLLFSPFDSILQLIPFFATLINSRSLS